MWRGLFLWLHVVCCYYQIDSAKLCVLHEPRGARNVPGLWSYRINVAEMQRLRQMVNTFRRNHQKLVGPLQNILEILHALAISWMIFGEVLAQHPINIVFGLDIALVEAPFSLRMTSIGDKLPTCTYIVVVVAAAVAADNIAFLSSLLVRKCRMLLSFPFD